MKRYWMFSVAAVLSCAAGAAQAYTIPGPGDVVRRSDPNGVYCREYTQEVMIGGRARSSYGTACQQPDGAWKVVTTDVQPTEEPVEYVNEPQYINPPQYVVPPVAYYEPYPYYSPYPVVRFSSYYGRGYPGYRSYGRGHHHHH